MDCLTFIAKIVEAIAWPATLVAIAWIFRIELRALIPSLSEFTFPGGGAKFARQLEQKLEEMKEEVAIGVAHEAQVEERLEALEETDAVVVKSNPKGVVMESWKAVEAAMREVLVDAKAATLLTLPTDPAGLVELLRKNDLASEKALATFVDLWALRNQIAREKDDVVSPDAANAFVSISRAAVQAMRAKASQKASKPAG